MPDAQPKPNGADVREQVADALYRMDHPTIMGDLSTAAGWAQRRYRERADMLAAAGLLATAEHDAQVLRDLVADRDDIETAVRLVEGSTVSVADLIVHHVLDRADRIAAGEGS